MAVESPYLCPTCRLPLLSARTAASPLPSDAAAGTPPSSFRWSLHCPSCQKDFQFPSASEQDPHASTVGPASVSSGPGNRCGPLTPQSIFDALSEVVVSQDHPKKILAVAAHNHLLRTTHSLSLGPVAAGRTLLEPSHVLLLGPTGTGKSLLARTLSQLLGVPYSINDAAAMTSAGYVGLDVESCLLRLLENARYDVARAERGIVFIDEIDKIARKSKAQVSTTRDVSGEGVQQGLLKMFEGHAVELPLPLSGQDARRKLLRPSTRGGGEDQVTMDTSHILFICSGSFEGLERVIARRVLSSRNGNNSSGNSETFTGSERRSRAMDRWLQQVLPEDLVNYGFLAEFVGRLPVLCPVSSLDEDALVRILREPRDALVKQYETIFRLSRPGTRLVVEDAALRAVARQALERGTGARALRSILDRVLLEAMFQVPSAASADSASATATESARGCGVVVRVTAEAVADPSKVEIRFD